MRVHFLQLHVRDTMVILEERKLPHPRCPQCNMLIPWSELNGRHIATEQCARGADCKRKRLADEELREILERAFQAYGEPLENVSAFRYLGRVMTAGDDDWHVVVRNLQRAINSWGQLLRILSQEGADLKVSVIF